MSESKVGSASVALERLKNLKETASPELLLELDTKLQLIKEPEVASSVEATLAQRGSRYGDFTDHAAICQNLMFVMQSATSKEVATFELLDPVKRQALTVIADKIARILSGDPNYDDNWHDIQGYAKLVEDRLPCNQKKES